MNELPSKRRVSLRDYENAPAAKRRYLGPSSHTLVPLSTRPASISPPPLAPLSAPGLPDEVWRLIFHYLDVGHICTRMVILNRLWASKCWSLVSAFVPGQEQTLDGHDQFEYRPSMYFHQLIQLPYPHYIRTLTLDNAKLTEADVAPIYNFSGLESLELLVVRGRTFQKLSRLTSLKSLVTWNCDWVNAEVLQQIGALDDLEHLTLNYCTQIDDEGLRHLSSLVNLKSLGLTDLVQISHVGLRHLSTLTNLRTLTLAFNPVTDEMVKVIAEHHVAKLEVLDLSAESLGEGRITDIGLAALSKLFNLRRLKLRDHIFTPCGLSNLSGLTNLEVLSLESTEGCVTGDSLRSLSKLVRLRKLNLDSCPSFDDDAMSALVAFTQLEHLNIAKTMFKRGLQHLSSQTHPKLTYLDISHSDKIDDAGLRHITRLTNLTVLHVYRCPKGHLTTKGTRALLELSNLELLDVRECPIAKDVAKVLRGRIKTMREDLTISAPTVTALETEDAPENEELPDSDDEDGPTPTPLALQRNSSNAMQIDLPLTMSAPASSHSTSHPSSRSCETPNCSLHSSAAGSAFSSSSMHVESSARFVGRPVTFGASIVTYHAPSQVQDDIRNYDFSEEDAMSTGETPRSMNSVESIHETNGDGEPVSVDHSVDNMMDLDEAHSHVDTDYEDEEAEGHVEAETRNLLAALISQRSRTQVHRAANSVPSSGSLSSSVYATPRRTDDDEFDVEEI